MPVRTAWRMHSLFDQADLRVGLRPERGRRAREELGLRRHLRMDLEADHDLPFAGAALDAIFRHLFNPIKNIRSH
jgi:hypothetical protein